MSSLRGSSAIVSGKKAGRLDGIAVRLIRLKIILA